MRVSLLWGTHIMSCNTGASRGEVMDEVTGTTRLYGIVGDPFTQVRSPSVFNRRFCELGVVLPLGGF